MIQVYDRQEQRLTDDQECAVGGRTGQRLPVPSACAAR